MKIDADTCNYDLLVQALTLKTSTMNGEKKTYLDGAVVCCKIMNVLIGIYRTLKLLICVF